MIHEYLRTTVIYFSTFIFQLLSLKFVLKLFFENQLEISKVINMHNIN